MYLGHIPYNPATDPRQYFAQGFQNLVSGLGQQSDRRKFNQDLAGLLSNQQFHQRMAQAQALQQAGQAGGTGFQGLAPQWPAFQGPPQMQSQQGQQAQMSGLMQSLYNPPATLSPLQQIHQNTLTRMNRLIKKREEGTATKNELSLLDKMEAGSPLVQITGERLLSPDKQLNIAEMDYEEKVKGKPLTSTEAKGVQTTIKEIVGSNKTLPFGIMPGEALEQSNMERLWESVMESTGYEGRGLVAQKQIENEFDRQVATLNRGKGVGVLANQYQWDRNKYESQIKSEPKTPPVAPRPELNILWPKLSDEIKSKVSKALMAGATVDEIKAALKLEGLE